MLLNSLYNERGGKGEEGIREEARRVRESGREEEKRVNYAIKSRTVAIKQPLESSCPPSSPLFSVNPGDVSRFTGQRNGAFVIVSLMFSLQKKREKRRKDIGKLSQSLAI